MVFLLSTNRLTNHNDRLPRIFHGTELVMWVIISPCTKVPLLSVAVDLLKDIIEWLDTNDSNLAVLYCPQGHPNYAGIITAALLKCMGAFPTSIAAYHFYRQQT